MMNDYDKLIKNDIYDKIIIQNIYTKILYIYYNTYEGVSIMLIVLWPSYCKFFHIK